MKRPLLAVLLFCAAALLWPARARANCTNPEGVYESSVTVCAAAPMVPVVDPNTGKGVTLHTICPEIAYDVKATADGMMCPVQSPADISGTTALLYFNSSAGNVTPDASGGGNNGTIGVTEAGGCTDSGVGGSDPISAVTGNYLPGLDGTISNNNFDKCTGAGQFVEQWLEFDNSGIQLDKRSFTIEMWTRAPDSASSLYSGTPPHDLNNDDIWLFLSCPNSGGTRTCFGIRKGNGGQDGKLVVSFDALSGTPTDTDLVSTNQAGTNQGLDDGKWHYIVFYFDSSTDQRAIYIDGEPAGSDVAGDAYQGTTPTCIFAGAVTTTGACGSATSAFQDIDNLRITQGLPPNKDLYGYARARYWGSHDYFNVNSSTQTPFPFAAESNNFGSFSGVAPIACSVSNDKLPLHVDVNMRTGVNFSGPYLDNSGGSNILAVRTYSTTEHLCKDDINLAVDTSFLEAPPTPVLDKKSATSLTWDWSYAVEKSSYSCNSQFTTYNIIIDSVAALSGPLTGVGSDGVYGQTSYSSSTLIPNTRHCMAMTASYTDPCLGGGAIGPSAETLPVCGCTYAQTPGAPSNVIQLSGTSAKMDLDEAPNSAGTLLDVETSTGNTTTASWSQVSGFSPVPLSGSRNRTVTGLNTSEKLWFASRAENCDADATSTGTASATSVITQPTVPPGFTAAAADYPVGCGKTDIVYNWSAVPTGSGASTQYSVFEGSSVRCTATGATSCVASYTAKAVPDTHSTYMEAFDSGAPFPWSVSTSTKSATLASTNIPAPTGLAGASISNGVQWTWTAPRYLCNLWHYDIFDQHTGGSAATANNSTALYDQVPLSPNTLQSIRVRAFDPIGGNGALSASATAYSAANPPTGLTAVSVTTGSVTLSWFANGNPAYTRYEVGVSPDGISVSSREDVTDNYTLTIATVSSLSPGTTYSFYVRAFSGSASDSYGLSPTATVSLTLMTETTSPALTGAGLSTSQLQWTWKAVQGASYYTLFASPPGGVIATEPASAGPSFSFTQTGLTPNEMVGAYVTAYNGQGLANAANPSYAFTNPVDPAGVAWAAVSSRTVSMRWDNGAGPSNSAGTLYEVDIATDATFGSVIETRGAINDLNPPYNVFTGLLPATTYWAQIRALSGSGAPGSFEPVGWPGVAQSTVTDPDPEITLSSSPPSAYVPQGDLRGLWHFDVDKGTWTPDSSGYGNGADLTCMSALCTSTPTFTAGLPALSTAASLTGQTSSLILVPDAQQYDTMSGSMTVAAWVDVAQTVQAPYAGIVARSSWTGTDFLLGTKGNSYYFYAGGQSVQSNTAVQPNSWTRVAGVYDPAPGANQLRLYVNGRLDAWANGVSPRAAGKWNVAVGNRICVSPATAGGCVPGAYDGGLVGRVDEVKLLNGAFSDADAQSDYAGAFASTLTLPSPNNGVTLYVPADAFGAPAVIYVSHDPLNHPITVGAATLMSGLSNEPTAQMLIPGSLVEIVPTIDGVPYSAPLASSASITMDYADADNNGLVDGMSPSISASTLRMYTLDTTVGRWTALPSSVDTSGHKVTGLTPHFSIFALFGATTIGSSISAARVYPNPWKRGSDGRYDAPALTFDDLPEAGTIRIFGLSGQKLVDLAFSGPDAGKLEWDGNNYAGRPAASGVYFALIKSADGSTSVIKFAIER